MRPTLNYQHLFYFWMVAREGGMSRAAKVLHVSAATLSVQIRQLEEQHGQKLFHRRGRTLELTDIGQTAFRYAETIFSVGRELEDYLLARPTGGSLRLDVGVTPELSKLATWRMLAPIRTLPTSCHLICHQAPRNQLVEQLVLHQVDVVLVDGPLDDGGPARFFNHHLGDTSVCIMGTPNLAASLRSDFPLSLDGAPLLLPKPGTAMRRSLDSWLGQLDIKPRLVGEFHDSSLLEVAGSNGDGLMPIPGLVAVEVGQRFGVEVAGFAEGLVESYYAVSAQRQIAHPTVQAIVDSAKELLAGTTRDPSLP